MMQQTVSVIDLNAVRHNALLVKERICGKKLYAVVKADAYGHGAERVALALQDIADGFCVAIVGEGVRLRVAGVTKLILVFTPIADKGDADAARFYGLDVTVNGKRAAALSQGLGCHIKVNTGMNRYGCSINQLKELLNSLNGLQVNGVYSHLYDVQNLSASEKQLELFCAAQSMVKSRYPDSMAHLSASAGVMLGGKYLQDGVRCGIALYGYMPQGFYLKGLKPALKVYAKRTQVTQFSGGGIGYGSAQKDYGTLSTYRLGYADGFMRTVPFGEGCLCMDGFISTENSEWIKVFDNADDYAKKCGTISYEVLCSVTRRSKRIYLN
ncbi:MAG: alanine racemase [Clostridia bacterium]|nr:alanine racemase [Clostridia bacterium]